MNRQEYMNKVVAFLKKRMEFEPESITEDSQLMGELGFNSLNLVLMANDAENEFNIVIEDEDMKKLVTVGNLVDFLEAKHAFGS